MPESVSPDRAELTVTRGPDAPADPAGVGVVLPVDAQEHHVGVDLVGVREDLLLRDPVTDLALCVDVAPGGLPLDLRHDIGVRLLCFDRRALGRAEAGFVPNTSVHDAEDVQPGPVRVGQLEGSIEGGTGVLAPVDRDEDRSIHV